MYDNFVTLVLVVTILYLLYMHEGIKYGRDYIFVNVLFTVLGQVLAVLLGIIVGSHTGYLFQ